jgi:hypothetical protein
LERKELTINPEDRPSCYEEKKLVEKAKRRLLYAEEKIDTVKKWVQIARQESETFETQLARLANFLDNDLARAAASLERMHGALDKYTQSTMTSNNVGPSSPTKSSPMGPADPSKTSAGEGDFLDDSNGSLANESPANGPNDNQSDEQGG